MKTCFCAIYMKAQKHACFHVNFPFNAYLYLPLHHNSKGSSARNHTDNNIMLHVASKLIHAPGLGSQKILYYPNLTLYTVHVFFPSDDLLYSHIIPG